MLYLTTTACQPAAGASKELAEVQLRLLRSCGDRWDLLWPKLGWKLSGTWTRYPGSFTWSLAAPEGHLPLVNQLRGVRLMDALLSHPGLKGRLPS